MPGTIRFHGSDMIPYTEHLLQKVPFLTFVFWRFTFYHRIGGLGSHAKLNPDIICPILVYSASSEPDLRKSFDITMFFLDTCVAWENRKPKESTCWLHQHTNNDLASNLSSPPLLFLGKDCIGTRAVTVGSQRNLFHIGKKEGDGFLQTLKIGPIVRFSWTCTL